jgi:uncharacterized protein (DUF58 family)
VNRIGTPGRRSAPWRSLNAVIIGVVAGVCGVVVARALFGPRLVVAGALFGVVSLTTGVVLSRAVSSTPVTSSGSGRLPDGSRIRRRLHAVNWFGPVAGSALAMFAWAGVAHSSGSGWVQAVGALLAAVLVTGLVAPLFPARRARVRCEANPADAEAGRAVTVTLTANGPVRIRPRYPVGPVVRAAGGTHGPRPVELELTPERRGVIEHLVVEVASSAPFGLLWWAREIVVALPRPLHVAPRAAGAGPIETIDDISVGDASRRVPSGIGEPRGIRPYRPGDARRSVHWPATSHVGSLMVRETERQTDDPVVIEVSLPRDPTEAEAETERVMGAVADHLAGGQVVVLATLEDDGRVVRVVRDRIDLGRRLARAVPPPAPPPEPVARRRARARP